MQVFTATITRRVSRRVQVAAQDETHAARMVRSVLRPGEKLDGFNIGRELEGMLEDDGREALARILDRDWFPTSTGSPPMPVSFWIGAPRVDTPGSEAYDKLAIAGLRVLPDGALAVGSAQSVPQLADWMRGTRFAGPGLIKSLRCIPGARPINLTLAGQASRAIALPYHIVTQVAEGRAA